MEPKLKVEKSTRGFSRLRERRTRGVGGGEALRLVLHDEEALVLGPLDDGGGVELGAEDVGDHDAARLG